MKALAVFLVFLFAVVMGLFMHASAFAAQGLLWSAGTPTVLKNVPLAAGVDSGCSTYRQDLHVVEYGATRNMCVDGDERLKIGTYSENGRYQAAVGFAYSNTMHALQGVCTIICRYSADTDVLVTEQLVSQYRWGLVVFRHASSRIKPVVSSEGTSYAFDTTDPDYAMKNDVGRYIATGTFNISSNGKWIVAELIDKGTVVIDVTTLSSRQITAEGYRYGFGMDPAEQLAVSNDGKSVAVTGERAGYRIFDVVPGCGQALIGELGFLPTTTLCPSTDNGIGILFPNFHEAQRPRFFGGGHELEVTVSSWVDGDRRVTFLTHDTPIAHQLKLLSLGDSFSSGEGETDDGYYAPGTNQSFDMCHVSTRAYSGVIARNLGISDVDAKNVACSGARISDIIGSDDQYWGQGDRLGATGLKLSVAGKQIAAEEAVDNFQPGRVLQSDFIERYNPEAITIGVGGNDAGLMGKLGTCAMPGTCEWAQPDRLADTAAETKRLFDSLSSLYARISDEVEGSRVFVVGYPDSIDPDGSCDPVTDLLINHTERVFIKNSIHYLNQIIRAAADKAGFHYVDIEDSFEGKKLCDNASPLALNGIRFGGDIALINTLPMLKIIGAETFHPTPTGHALIANTFLADYLLLKGDATNANDEGIEPSSYWNSENGAVNRSLYAVDFASQNGSDPQHVAIAVPDGTLQPSSVVTIEIHSDPLRLATFVVGEGGGIDGEVPIPPSMGEGFHTLHLLGVNRGGESVDMYQFLTIGRSGGVVGMGDGESISSSHSSLGLTGSTALASLPVDSRSVLNPMDVLGAQSTSGLVAGVQKKLLPVISYSEHAPWVMRALLIGATVVACALTLCTILFLRRWAKPGS